MHIDDPAQEGYYRCQRWAIRLHVGFPFTPLSCFLKRGLYSRKVAEAAYTFSCHGSRGAIAVLGDFGCQQKVLNNHSFRNYIRDNHSSWCTFAAGKGHVLEDSSIILVSGWVKTSEWALATVNNYGSSHSISFSATAGAYASSKFQFSTSNDVQMSVTQRCGPRRRQKATKTSDSADSEILPCDQCLFLRYYKLKSRGVLQRFCGSKVVMEYVQDDVDKGSSARAFPAPRFSTKPGGSSRTASPFGRVAGEFGRAGMAREAALSEPPPYSSSNDIGEEPSSDATTVGLSI